MFLSLTYFDKPNAVIIFRVMCGLSCLWNNFNLTGETVLRLCDAELEFWAWCVLLGVDFYVIAKGVQPFAGPTIPWREVNGQSPANKLT